MELTKLITRGIRIGMNPVEVPALIDELEATLSRNNLATALHYYGLITTDAQVLKVMDKGIIR